MGSENSGRIRVIGALAGVGSGQLPHGFRHEALLNVIIQRFDKGSFLCSNIPNDSTQQKENRLLLVIGM
jgi:hypothetical protein